MFYETRALIQHWSSHIEASVACGCGNCRRLPLLWSWWGTSRRYVTQMMNTDYITRTAPAHIRTHINTWCSVQWELFSRPFS